MPSCSEQLLAAFEALSRTASAAQVVALGREVLGGNGILHDFLAAKAFADMEAYYSYEGEEMGWAAVAPLLTLA